MGITVFLHAHQEHQAYTLEFSVIPKNTALAVSYKDTVKKHSS
jgi:hypothetical protein